MQNQGEGEGEGGGRRAAPPPPPFLGRVWRVGSGLGVSPLGLGGRRVGGGQEFPLDAAGGRQAQQLRAVRVGPLGAQAVATAGGVPLRVSWTKDWAGGGDGGLAWGCSEHEAELG